ncbi:hypothetical protein HII36_03745 [Nonomuraea sp. NN258]|uniref:hypothetical protein n=1 Tax=Nonomuraea antri TaxID=2730852 RepID=UPI00156A1F1E|nr:hypothetical protein [Nonomuraea antri]NRQ30946.1 hypothetical protein [Nonomuraea antri]
MSAACPDIPIVVLPENNLVRASTRPSPRVAAALSAAVDALTRLHTELLSPDGAGGVVKAAMDAAVDRADHLAVVAAVAPMDTAPLRPIVPNHEYFGVRTAHVDDAYLAAEMTTVIARALTDLRNARLDLNDQAAEVRAMAALLRGLDPGSGPAAPEPAAPAHPAPYRPGGDELTRWVITHHLYFLLNLAAADAVSQAIAGLRDGDRDAALAALRTATVHVRGFTAAMMHSGDMSAPCYDAKVRPTMQPPAVPVALTGRTQPEHRSFRKAMRGLLPASPESFGKLFAADPELAVARDALLEADLQDIERHIIVTAALVGDDFSIIQGEASAESAIAVLRRMRHIRAEAYQDLMRYGDVVSLTA